MSEQLTITLPPSLAKRLIDDRTGQATTVAAVGLLRDEGYVLAADLLAHLVDNSYRSREATHD